MLVAQCPECGTAFQVSLNELNLAEGRLQCGHCHAVFHAEDPLLEAAGAEEKAAQIDLDEVDLVQNQSANDTAADAQTDWEVDPVAAGKVPDQWDQKIQIFACLGFRAMNPVRRSGRCSHQPGSESSRS